MKRIAMLAALWLFFSLAAKGDENRCTDIGNYDFKNATLSVKDGIALGANPPDPETLPFKDGTCNLSDDPQSVKPDWSYTIVSDFVMSPTRQSKVRIIRIYENHLAGSGSWDRVMAFVCKGGALEKVWQHRFEEAVKLIRVNELQFKVKPLNAKPKPKGKNTEFGVYQCDNTHRTFKRR